MYYNCKFKIKKMKLMLAAKPRDKWNIIAESRNLEAKRV
jgi:hypothetical protein